MTAVINKAADHLRLATVSWLKEPLECWVPRAEAQLAFRMAAAGIQYALPKISDGTTCIDNTWTASSLTTQFNDAHLAQLSAEDSGRYSSGAQKISVHSVHVSRRNRRLVSLQLCRANPNPLRIAGWLEGGFMISTSS